MKEPKYKIFENGTVKETLQRCLNEGYIPLTTKQLVKARNRKEIPNQGCDTSTIYLLETGEIIDATKKELQTILNGKLKGRVLFVGGGGGSGLLGGNLLDSGGRFVGVKV